MPPGNTSSKSGRSGCAENAPNTSEPPPTPARTPFRRRFRRSCPAHRDSAPRAPAGRWRSLRLPETTRPGGRAGQRWQTCSGRDGSAIGGRVRKPSCENRPVPDGVLPPHRRTRYRRRWPSACSRPARGPWLGRWPSTPRRAPRGRPHAEGQLAGARPGPGSSRRHRPVPDVSRWEATSRTDGRTANLKTS